MMSINEVQKAIADAISNGVSKEDLKSLEVKFMEMLDQRNGDQKDVESLFSKFQSDMETKLASLQTSQAKAGFIGVQKKESFGDFLVKVRNGDAELKAFTRKNLVENTGDLGGYLVPDEFMNEVLRVQLEETVVRRNGARVIPMNSPIMKIPALNMASNASGSLFGGVTAYWNGEAQEKTESNPKFKQITLEAKKLIGYVESSDELIDDAIVSMGQLLSDVFSQTIAFEEDAAFLTGNGVNKPLGIINAGATVTVNRAATNSVQTTDLINMLLDSIAAAEVLYGLLIKVYFLTSTNLKMKTAITFCCLDLMGTFRQHSQQQSTAFLLLLLKKFPLKVQQVM